MPASVQFHFINPNKLLSVICEKMAMSQRKAKKKKWPDCEIWTLVGEIEVAKVLALQTKGKNKKSSVKSNGGRK